MSTAADRLSLLPSNLRAAVSHYADTVRRIAGARALHLSLLGSAAAGTWVPGRHRVHTALVLDRADLELLRQLAGELAALAEVAFAAPLVFTPQYIRASLDSFPLELLEIQQQHLVVFGDDCFAGLVFDATHVRLQCERELKSMLLAMRQAVLASGGQQQRLFAEHPDAADGLLRVLRGVAWLKGAKESLAAAKVVDVLERELGRPLPGVRALVKAHGPLNWPDYCALHAELEALERAADGS